MITGVGSWFLEPTWGFGSPFVPNVNFTTTTNPWNPAFVADLQAYGSVFRMMDWGAVNYSRVTSWSQRRLPTDQGNADIYTDAGTGVVPGLAYELQFDICNRANQMCWIALPVLADDDYIHQVVVLAKAKLRTHLIVEVSNEVSGGWFRQTADATAAAIKAGLTNCGSDQWRTAECWVVNRTMLVAKEIRLQGVDGGAVACGVASMGILSSALQGQYKGEKLEALCMSAYFGNGRDGATYTLAQAKTDIDRLVSGEDGVLQYVSLAKGYGLPVYSYESGQHVLTNAKRWNENPDAGVAEVYLLDAVSPYLKMAVHYTDAATCGNNSGTSCWGLKTQIGGPETSKSTAFKNWVRTH